MFERHSYFSSLGVNGSVDFNAQGAERAQIAIFANVGGNYQVFTVFRQAGISLLMQTAALGAGASTLILLPNQNISAPATTPLILPSVFRITCTSGNMFAMVDIDYAP